MILIAGAEWESDTIRDGTKQAHAMATCERERHREFVPGAGRSCLAW
jgi:hypothetical protein